MTPVLPHISHVADFANANIDLGVYLLHVTGQCWLQGLGHPRQCGSRGQL